MEWFASLGPAGVGWPGAVIPERLRFAINSGPLEVLGMVAALVLVALVVRQALAQWRSRTEMPHLLVLEGRKELGRHAA